MSGVYGYGLSNGLQALMVVCLKDGSGKAGGK
jgi:hypothetical protein